MELTLPLQIRSSLFGRGPHLLTVGGARVGSIQASEGELVVEYLGHTLRYGRTGSGRETTLVLPDGETIEIKDKSALTPGGEFVANGETFLLRGGPFSIRVFPAPMGKGTPGERAPFSPTPQPLLHVRVGGLFRLRFHFDPRLPVPFEFALVAWLAAQRYRQQLLTVVIPVLLMAVGRLVKELF